MTEERNTRETREKHERNTPRATTPIRMHTERNRGRDRDADTDTDTDTDTVTDTDADADTDTDGHGWNTCWQFANFAGSSVHSNLSTMTPVPMIMMMIMR